MKCVRCHRQEESKEVEADYVVQGASLCKECAEKIFKVMEKATSRIVTPGGMQ